jgi:anti-sigma factor RsiW
MKSCAELDALVTPFVDGEVAGEVCGAIRAHLEMCPACRARVAAEQAARALIRARREALRRRAPAHLLARCRELAAAARPRARRAGWRWVAAAAAAAIAASVGVHLVLARFDRAFAAQLVIDHLKCFELTSGTPGGLDPVRAEQQWTTAQGWHLRVPPGTGEVALVDLRRCVHSEGTMAHLLYRHQGRPISLFVLPQTTRRAARVEVMGHEAVIWSGSGRTYAVLGQEDPTELARVVAYLRGAVD